MPRRRAERPLAGALPAQGQKCQGAAAGRAEAHRGSGRGIDGRQLVPGTRAQPQAIRNRQRAFLFTGRQRPLQIPGTGSDPGGRCSWYPEQIAGGGAKFGNQSR